MEPCKRTDRTIGFCQQTQKSHVELHHMAIIDSGREEVNYKPLQTNTALALLWPYSRIIKHNKVTLKKSLEAQQSILSY